jgi:uncharacterized repeat protein (TIGR01451 family)
VTLSATTLTSESCTNNLIDPGEVITLSFSLQNNGPGNTTNLVATLQATGGVTSPSGPQTFGVLTAGGPSVSRSFSLIPIGTCGGTFTATLQLQDGATSLGTVSTNLSFGALVSQVTSFTNSGFITIPTSGAATPYPSTITVSGLTPNVQKVTVTLNQVVHTQPHDIEILLMSPGGQTTWIMSNSGGINVINNVALTFDNAASASLPNQGQIVSGTFKPTHYLPDDVLPAPAPAGPYVADLSVFNGGDPNGTWQLFVFDDTAGFSGSISGGWTLNVTTPEPLCCIDRNSVDLALGMSATPDPVIVGNNITFAVTATNRGPSAATGVMVTNPVPPNASFVSATTSQGSCSNYSGTVVCSLGTLTNGASATMNLTLRPTLAGTLPNSASVSASQPDNNITNNSAAYTAAVIFPTVSIGDTTVAKGSTGTTTNAVFALQLNAPSSLTATIDYFTADVTANAGLDYLTTNGTVTFTPGQTNGTIRVTVLGTNINEATEYFSVVLTNSVNVTIGKGQGTGTTINNQPLPALTIADSSVTKGTNGTTNINFAVTINTPSDQVVSFNYATADGTAKAGSDYLATNSTAFISPGQTSTSVAVAVLGNTLNKSNLTFTVNLSGAVNTTFSRSQAVGTIINSYFLPNIAAAGASLTSESCAPANGVIDPNETVTVNFTLRNASGGSARTTNLVATLLQSGGIVSPGAAQTYGALAPGASTNRPFTFTANGRCGDTLVAVLQLQDGANNLGTVTNFLTTGKSGSAINNFSNTGFITIPDFGAATPYPSTLSVAGLGAVTKATVTLFNLSHSYPSDVQALLVGPGGQTAFLISGAGDGLAATNVTLTFDDTAASSLPSSSQLTTGTYKPTAYPPASDLPAPAPASPYGTNLSVFNGTDPTGTWSLYVNDDSVGDSGNVSGGWRLTLTTVAPPVCCGSDSLADLSVTAASSAVSAGIGSNLTFTVNMTNLGPSTASDVVLTDTLPANISFVSATSTLGTLTNINGVISCSLGTMTNGASATLTINVTTLAAGYATNSASVSSRAADPSPANNSSSTVTTVALPPPIAAFSASPLSGSPPLAVTFSENSLGTITNRSWTFGNGATTNTTATNFVFTYSTAGTNTVSLTVIGPGGTNVLTQSNYIVVTNLPPHLVVSPSNLGFGSVLLGQSSTGAFQVVNSGGLPLSGTASVPLPFAIQSGTPLNLAPGQTGLVMVTFSPGVVGAFSNTVVFSSNGGNSTNAVTGSGYTPAQLAVSPPTLSFGTVAVGSNAQANFTLTNSGSVSLTNGSLSISAGPFTLVSPGSFTIGGFAATNIAILFTPSSAGVFTNVAVFSSDGGNNTNQVTGTGAVVPGASFVGSPTIGLKPLAVSFTDNSAGTITNRFWTFGDGSTTNTAATNFTYAYANAGTNTVVLTVTGPVGTNTLSRTNYIVVTNLPPQLTLNPASLGFGSIIIGQSSTQTFQLVNTGGTTLNGSAGSTPPFGVQSGSPYTLTPGQTGLVSITFSPTNAAGFSNVVTFTSNGGNSTNTVTGTGLTPPHLAVSPASFNFGVLAVGSNTQTLFVATNTGGATLNAGSVSIAPGSMVFSIISGTPFSLPGFGSTNVVISFSPTNAASFSNAVVFSSANDGGSTNPIIGTGAFAPLANFTANPTNGVRPLTVNFTDTSTGTITNRFWDLGDGTSTNTGATSFAHTYTTAGTNSVTLIVTGPLGTNALVMANLIAVTNPPPLLNVSPASLNFGQVIIGQTNIQSFQIVNAGGLTLTGNVSTTLPFALQDGNTYSLAPGQTGSVAFVFSPTNTGSFSNVVTFISNGGNSTNPVTGVGLTPAQLAISPGSLDFGSSIIGSNVQAGFIVTNSGGASLTNGVAALSPGGPFSIISGATFNLAGFGSTNVQLRFSPTSAGSFSNAVVFTSSAGTSTNTVTGTGLTPPQLTVLPASLNFGAVAVGSNVQANFVVTNSGGATLSNGTAAVSAGAFSILSGASFTLTGFGFTNVAINFAPTNAANYSNAVLFSSSNAGGSTNSVAGTGAFLPLANFTATPTNGLVPLTVTFTDSSTGTITNRFWDFGDGSNTNTSATTFTHTYATAGTNSVILTVNGPLGTNNLARASYIIATNLPPLLAVSPASLNFGQVVLGQTNTQSFQVVNNGGLTLTGSVTVTPPFVIQGSGLYNLASGQTGSVAVSFSPTTAGSYSNIAVFTGNGGNSTNAVTGVGLTPPQLTVLPASLDFGAVIVGSNAQASFILTNQGGATLSNGTASVSAGPFSILSGSPFTLSGFAATNLVLSFSPAGVGAFTNFVTFIVPSAAASTNVVTGTGALAPLANFAGAPASGSPPLLVTFSDNSTGTITNHFWDFGDGSTSNTTALQVSHTYTAASTNTVSLTVTGPVGSNFLSLPAYIVVTNLPPLLVVNPTNLDFGNAFIGDTNFGTFQVINGGGLPLTGSVSAPLPFAIQSGATYNVNPGQTSLVTVAFSPTDSVSFSNVITFVSNGGNSTNNLTGVGVVPPQLGVRPIALDFGMVDVDAAQTAQASFVMTNRGAQELTNILAFVDSGPFTILSATPIDLPGFSSTNLALVFGPTTAGSFSNVVIVLSDGGNSTNALTGVGAAEPQANFTGSPASGPKPLVVGFSDISTGTITNRFWDFGDGSTTNTTVTAFSHTYASAGTNTVTLIASGPFGVSSRTFTNYIAVTNQFLITSIQSVGTNVLISFTSMAGQFYRVQYTDSLSPPNWLTAADFVPGTGDIAMAIHLGGASNPQRFYRAQLLTPTDLAPVAAFTANPTSGLVPLAVIFTDASAGYITNRFWDFGDGSTTNTSATSVAHTYLLAGTNTVSLTVAGPVGTNSLALPGYITVTNPPPMLVLNPTNLDFGSVIVGQTNTLVFQLVNGGGLTLTGSVSATQPFLVQSGNPFSIAPAQTGLVQIAFSPTNAASFSNVVVFVSNGGNSTNTVTGSSLTPAQLVVSPPSFDFGIVAIGTNAQTTFVVTNTGGAALTSGTATVTPGPFLILSGAAFNLTGFGSTNVVVQFIPGSAASFTNSLVVSSANAGASTNTLTGTGALIPAAHFSASPTAGLLPLVVTFTDSSTGTITNRFWDFGDGSTTNTTATSFTHTYALASTNTVLLTVTGPAGTNTLTQPGYIVVTNLPPNLILGPPSLAFGSVVIGQTNTLSIQLTNTGGLTLTGSVSATPPFAVQTGSPFSLAPGASGAVQISFSPTNAASFSNVVVFVSNGGSNTNTVTGTGLTPAQMAVSPTSLGFGTVAVGSNATLSFTVTNLGGAFLNNATATISGAPFTIVSGAAFTLAGFGSTNVVVSFTPASAGNFSNAVVFASASDGGSTNSVIGTGAFVPVASFTGTPTSGAPPLVVSFTDNSTGTITNRFWDFGDGSTTNTTATTLSHTYASAGTNTVTLIVSGPLGASPSTFPNYITVTNQLLITSIQKVDGNVLITFTSAAGQFYRVQYTDSLSPPNWLTAVDFVPGTGGIATAIHLGGGGQPQRFYRVRLLGTTDLTPVAAFNANPTSGTVPLTVTFTDTSAGYITNRFWDFGDGSTTNTTATNLVHTYSLVGTNTVFLTVTGPVGTNTLTRPAYVAVTNPPPQLALAPPNLAFGSVVIGQTNTLSFQLTNAGGLTLTGSVSTTPPFALPSGTLFTIPPGQIGQVLVSFSPTSAGSFSNVVVFISNGGNSTNTLTGAGLTPAQLVVVPAHVDFGTVDVDAGTNAQAVLVVTNLGMAPVTNATASLASGSPEFSIVSSTSFSLAGLGVTNLTLNFSPTNQGLFSNSVIVLSDGGNSTNALTGTGALEPLADFVGTPTSGLNPLTVTFTDTSRGTITNRIWYFGDTTFTNTTATSVSHTYTQARHYSVSFDVTGPLGESSTLFLNYIEVTNPPPHLALGPSSLDFGSVVLGQSNTLSFQLTNTGGQTLAGSVSTMPPFAVQNGSPFSIAPGQTGSVQVSFSPTNASTFSNAVVFVSNGGSSTNSVTGTGLTPVPLMITSIQSSGPDVLISFTSNAGQYYRVEYTDSLSPTSWLTAVDFVPGTGAIVTAAHLGGAGHLSRFYRVRLLTGSDLVPVANFTGSPTSGQVPLAVTFNDASSGYITNRFWDFGDGSTTNTTTIGVSHTYVTSGSSSVLLTVTGPFGTSTLTQTNFIVAAVQLVITNLRLSGPDVIVSFTSAAGQSYSLDYSDDFSLKGWNTAVDAVPGTGDIVTVTHFGGANGVSRFYRVRQIQ